MVVACLTSPLKNPSLTCGLTPATMEQKKKPDYLIILLKWHGKAQTLKEFEDNLTALKELEMLSQCAPTYILRGCGPVMMFEALKTGKVFNPLEQLGLHIKEEFYGG
ncbi:hypothetical protein ACH5RR_022332 [Cinchona calisaya]|uniref:Uncharacterized protein n=1 Tax=Cinchona calisaya TaxID=153742 RepID=A0ABD2ZAW6_9GENT